jgi:hypothetical protein
MNARGALTLLAFVGAAVPGCAPSAPRVATEPAPQALSTREPRIDAIAGRELVIPVGVVSASGRVAWMLGGSAPVEVDPRVPLRARLDDGREAQASLWYLSASAPAAPREPAPNLSVDERWMDGRGRALSWSARRATPDEPPPRDAVVLLRASLPEAGLGLGLWINGRRHDVQWLLPLAPDDESARGALRPTAPATAMGDSLGGEGLRRIAAHEASHPTRRWRARLTLDGLGPADLIARPFDDPVVEALAAHADERWRIALVRLWNADPDLAGRVRVALAGVIDFGEDPRLAGAAFRWMPAWAPDDARLEELRDALLARDAAPADLRRAAERFLDRRPALAAAIIDAGGLSDADSGTPITTALVVNLGPQRSLAWIARSEARPRELAPAEPMSATRLMWWPDDPLTRDAEITAHVGTAERALPVGPTRPAARPPGLAIAPMRPEHTMASFLTEAPSPSDVSGVRAVLQRDRQGWALVVRCALDRAGSSGPAPGEELRVWLGKSGRGATVIAASPAMRAPPGSSEPVRVSVGAAEWSATIRIPAGAIEPDGTLRLGLERIAPRGVRWSWPVSMFPWQSDPGRAAIDLRAWGSLEP